MRKVAEARLNADPQDRDLSGREQSVFSALVQEAAGFYGLLLTIASAFLGGTLIFIDRIAHNPEAWTVFVLAGGWGALVATVVLVALVRWRNVETMRAFLEGRHSELPQKEKLTRRLTVSAIVCLGCGMLAVSVFGVLNLLV